MVVGYARVSTPEQKLEAQDTLLEKEGCERVYTDVASGTRDDRKGLNEMLKYMRRGDTILTYRNDRLFRSLRDMVGLIDRFNEAGVHFKSLSEPEFDTTSANGRFLLQVFAAVAEFERELISERTKVGLDNARRRNKLLGRPRGPKQGTIERYHYARHLYEDRGVSIDKACRRAGIGKTSFYRVGRELAAGSLA